MVIIKPFLVSMEQAESPQSLTEWRYRFIEIRELFLQNIFNLSFQDINMVTDLQYKVLPNSEAKEEPYMSPQSFKYFDFHITQGVKMRHFSNRVAWRTAEFPVDSMIL